MRLLWQALIQYDWCTRKKGKFGHQDRYTHKENACDDEGRDGDDASTGQGTPKIASKPPESWREA